MLTLGMKKIKHIRRALEVIKIAQVCMFSNVRSRRSVVIIATYSEGESISCEKSVATSFPAVCWVTS